MFAPHGQYTIRFDVDSFVFIGSGAWNLEGSQQMIAQIDELLESLNSPFAFVFDTNEVEGLTPSSTEAWSEAIPRWLDKGLSVMIRITDTNSPNYKLFIRPIDEYLQTLTQFHYAESLDDAIAKIHKLGFQGFSGDKVAFYYDSCQTSRQI